MKTSKFLTLGKDISKIGLVICAVGFFSSCGSKETAQKKSEGWQTKLAAKRTFQIRNVWVKQTPEIQNIYYRKINRMSPLLYVDKANGDMLIEGNAIDGISGYKRMTGQEIWNLKITNGVESPALLFKDRVYFGANDGFFYSINASTGKIIWSFPTRIENLSEPIMNDGVLYFLSGANTLFALDATNGKQLWLYSRQDPSPLSVRGGSRPALKNGVLYVGFSDGYLVALNASSGTVKWEKQLNRNKKFRDLDTNPVADYDYLYALGFDDSLYCVSLKTGEIIWKNDVGGYGGILIQKDRLYYATTTSEIYSVEKTTGKKLWSVKVNEGVATAPALYRGMLVYGESSGALKFLDSASGRHIGEYSPGKGIMSTPTIDESKNLVFFMSNEANLYALEVGFKYPNPFPYLR